MNWMLLLFLFGHMDGIHAYATEADCKRDAATITKIEWKCVDDRYFDTSKLYSRPQRIRKD